MDNDWVNAENKRYVEKYIKNYWSNFIICRDLQFRMAMRDLKLFLEEANSLKALHEEMHIKKH